MRALYIQAKLPAYYGRFNQIRKDNYPFRQAFTTYLEAIAEHGNRTGLDIDELMGALEDALAGDGYLPDVPAGDAPVLFRYQAESPVLEAYFGASAFPNRAIVLSCIRLALRLSAKYGTSLARMTLHVREAPLGGAGRPDGVREAPLGGAGRPDGVREAPLGGAGRPDGENNVEIVEKQRVPGLPRKTPVKLPMPPKAPRPESPVRPEPEQKPATEAGDVLERLKYLTEKGDALLSGTDSGAGDGPSAGTGSGQGAVVTTNPLLGDFFS